MVDNTRLVTGESIADDITNDRSLRPKKLEYFTGQRDICENLSVFIKAAISRNEALDHVLLSGPPGLGKTTLSQIIANEMGGNIKITSGPVITKPGDLASLLTNLQERDVLFIDEIHRMHPAVEEILYPAMEDFKIDILIGEGQSARAIRIDIPQFTLIAATTRLGLLSQPLRERFGIPFRFNFYTISELSHIITRNAEMLCILIDDESAKEIAKRSRGTPRIASRLLRRVRDFANIIADSEGIDIELTVASLDKIKVDPYGLDSEDKKYLSALKDLFGGGPTGIETLAAALSETSNTLEDVIEPYLIQLGFIQKTPRGRIITEKGYDIV
ncbi:MAG: Holliday junction branch migration DNA helicase RuvB [Holosporales bacterium]|jgi:Holliday junction DNA helicase RuvB|nr:Holliday junction branch migration DNA helicase RuvB [Holosporales bacterium]